jgi:RHS repeat-associated protein
MINIIAIAVAIILTPLILVAKNQGKTYLYLKDHLGSTRVVIERETGNVIETRSYYPYGKQMPGKGVMAGAPATTTEKFTGKELDGETDLYYFGARYYDAEVGRWISRDPMEQFESPYVYSGNGFNPLSGTDDNGKEFKQGIMGNKKLMSAVAAVIKTGNIYAVDLDKISTDIFMQRMGPGEVHGFADLKSNIFIAMPVGDVLVKSFGEDIALNAVVAWEIGNKYGIIKEQETGIPAKLYGKSTCDYKEAYLSINNYLESQGSVYRMGFNTKTDFPELYEKGKETDEIQTFK